MTAYKTRGRLVWTVESFALHHAVRMYKTYFSVLQFKYTYLSSYHYAFCTKYIILETCFDYKKNQNEKGVDCGGICYTLHGKTCKSKLST